MSEADAVSKSRSGPVTVISLRKDFENLGIKKGMRLLVHSSLSKLGWVCGGPVAVIRAIEEVIGADGTLVMPAHSGDLSEPSSWQNPPVPESWYGIIRKTMPPFDRSATPTRGMGKIPETFRKMKAVVRSNHPQVSFVARGNDALYITDDHQLDFGMGEGSPLARMYELRAFILMIGVTHSNNSSLHLAEYRAEYPSKEVCKDGAPIVEKGQRIWKEFFDISLSTDDFEDIGKAFESEYPYLVNRGKVGYADSLLIPQKELVDFATRWMSENRE